MGLWLRSAPRPDGRRVLVVARWPVGGIRTYFLYNYPELLRAGYRLTFVGPDDAAFASLRAELADWEGSEFVGAPLSGKRCALWRPVRRLLRTGRFDLIHSHGVLAAAQVAAASLGFRVPHVMTAHDVFRPCHTATLAGRARLWVLGRMLRGLDALVPVGEDVRTNFLDHLPALKSGSCRVVCIPNGVATGRFAGATRETKSGEGEFLIGFLGRFMEQKGFLPLLDALERLEKTGSPRPWRLLAMGSGDYEREYRAEAERRGLASRISFVPFERDVSGVLRRLDLLAVPSLWEACPLLPMEALAAGVPILGSDCIGLREVLRGTPARVAPAGDAEKWAATLAEAMREPREEAARAYAEEAQARFDVGPAARRLRELFDDLLKRADQSGERARMASTLARVSG